MTGMLRVLRRAVTVPLVVALELSLLAASPLLLIVAVFAAAVVGSTRPLRSTALVVAYAVIELSVFGRMLGRGDDWDGLLRDVLTNAYRTMACLLDVRLVVEEGSTTGEELSTSRGLVVLARHCGPGDSLFVAWLLATHYNLRLRVVLKSVMRLEPAVDLAGDHLPLCFIGRDRRRARNRINTVAASMSAGDALLLFPEGGNFSWPRWRGAVASLSATGAYGRANRARAHTHTLAPRLGGALAALTGSPAADVLLLAHTGFAEDGRDRPWWRLPIHRALVVRTVLVPATTVPRTREALSLWLDAAWTQIDAWVDNHAHA
jgi:1-acyl-sn-glycerol-3-phosphate acyltransferase